MNGEHDPVVHDPASGGEPIEVPLEFREPPSLVDEIRRFVRIEMSRAAQESGFESFEEANDLEFSDDDDFSSAHELTEDQEMAMMSVARSSRDKGDSHDKESVSGRQAVDGDSGGDVEGRGGKGARVNSEVVEEVGGKESAVGGSVQGGSKGS